MASSTRMYVLLIFCISGSANVLYLIISKGALNKQGFQSNIPGKATDYITNSPDIYRINITDERKSKKAIVSAHRHHIRNKQKHSTNAKFTYYINEPVICEPANGTENFQVDLVVLVISHVKNFLRRVAIRNTWGSDVHESFPKVRLFFLVGQSSDAQYQPQVEKESELFSDIIQPNVEEMYENLTNKSLAMMQWIRDFCFCAKFILKTDDDMYINIPNLMNELLQIRPRKFFFCYVFEKAPPVRDKNSKWYTSLEEYRFRYFPNYCSGTAYAFSANIAADIYESSKKIKFLKMEDVYITGLLAQENNIILIHGDGFWFLKRKSTGCDFKKAISGHEVPVREMYIIHAQVRDSDIDCKTNINRAISGDDNDVFQQWQQSDVT